MTRRRGLAETVSSTRLADQARRIAMPRNFGPPALAAIGLSALGSSILYILGVVSQHALGLTPVVFALAAIFFVLTAMTYIEGNSIHPEQGGASTFARYAFDEFWSFVAGWAILLDYLIAMSLAMLAISSYLTAFWGELDRTLAQLLIAAAAIAVVAWNNIRGVSAGRYKRVLRIGIVFFVLSVAIVAIGLVSKFHPGRVADAVHLGTSPTWRGLVFAAVLAAVATVGIEAASGLAPEIRVARRDLRRLVGFAVLAVVVILVGLSSVAVMATSPAELGSRYIGAPLLGAVAHYDPLWLRHVLRYAVGLIGALVLIASVNGMMLGLSRVTYSLATNRQIPSLLGRLDRRGSTPFVTVVLASVISFALASSTDVDFLAGIFAFGSMLVFTIAHLSVVALRFREPQRERALLIPWSIKLRGGSVPVPAAIGALLAVVGWLSVVVLHSGARYVGGAWMVGGIALYVIYRRSQDKPLRMRFTIPARALQETPETEYGSILVPVFGTALDDDIISTAGRLAAEEGEEGEGGSIIEALYIVEVPMSLPLDARIPDEQLESAKRAVARAKEIGEEYEGVTVATAMVRGRSLGAAVVSEAKRRGVEAIVLAADDPPHMRGGALLGGRGRGRERSVGAMTRYVVEKAPCRVILTATPDHEPARHAELAGAPDGRPDGQPGRAPAKEERLPS